MKKIPNDSSEYFLVCESFRTFIIMIAAGGFLGAYTYILKGGVFCNAQTANLVLLAVNFGKGNFYHALYYLIPIFAYFAGSALSEFLPKHVNRLHVLRWDTLFVAFEMIAVFFIGLVPDDAPNQICQIAVNFIASMQYNTFRQAYKVPMATTFCTNHIRQVGINFVKFLEKHDDESGRRLYMHFFMLCAFAAGGMFSSFLSGYFGGKTIWFSEILLGFVFIDLLRADLVTERDKFDVVPHGH